MSDKGLRGDSKSLKAPEGAADFDTFVLEKSIFSRVFEKDIKRVYIYKKAERIAKALILVLPAFKDIPSLRERVARSATGLLDASLLPPIVSREAMSRELLGLSSILAVVRSSGLLSPMNSDIVGREVHQLLEEVASYDEPRISLEGAPTLAELLRTSAERERVSDIRKRPSIRREVQVHREANGHRGHVLDSHKGHSGRREAVLSILKERGPSYIKDISTIVRDVSEKTIQRELQSLVVAGVVGKEGERRWTRYFLTPGGGQPPVSQTL